MYKLISIFLTTSLFGLSGGPIKTSQYFVLKENQIDRFASVYIRGQTDPGNLDKIPAGHAPRVEFSQQTDTITDKLEIIYKTINIEGHKAFYAVETVDTTNKNPA